MAPEQARGEADLVDRRADVFSLGSILCEILTGEPAFTGGSAREILAIAARSDTADALARVDGCGADAELRALARDCLAVAPDDRPSDAGVVAGRMTTYLAGVQERLRAAELARAAEAARAIEAEAKAAAERRARRLTAALAATILVAGSLAGAGWRYIELQRLERARRATDRVNLALREATRLRGLAQGAAPGDLPPWAVAASAAEKARDLLEPGVEPGLRRQVEELAADLAAERRQAEATAEADRRDRRLLAELVEIRSAEADDLGGWGTDAAYAEAFHTAGLDVVGRPAAEVAAAIRARPWPSPWPPPSTTGPPSAATASGTGPGRRLSRR
jgi:serine/threonine-protein kinase